MPGSKWKHLCALLVGSLIVLSLPVPSHALDCKKTTVNRSGTSQFGQFISLIGQTLFTEIDSGPFPNVTPLFVPVISSSLIMTGPAVPATGLSNPPITSVCTTGLSVADHRIDLSAWTWVDSGGNPSDPIADPMVLVEGMPNGQVAWTFMELGNRTVHLENIHLSVGMGKQGLGAFGPPPPPPGGNPAPTEEPPTTPPILLPPGDGGGDFQAAGDGGGIFPLGDGPPGGLTILEGPPPPPIVIPPTQQPPTIVTAVGNPQVPGDEKELLFIPNLDLSPGQLKTFIASTGQGPATMGQLTAVARFIAHGSDSISAVFGDQPFRLLPPVPFLTRLAQDQFQESPGVFGAEEIWVDAFDPDSGPNTPLPDPNVTLVGVTEDDGVNVIDAIAAGDVVITGQTRAVTADVTGRRTSRLCINAQIRLKTRTHASLTFYHFQFLATDSQGQTRPLETFVTVFGSHRAGGSGRG